MSLQVRKRIEQGFGWVKAVSELRHPGTVFSKSGMSLGRPEIGGAKRVDPLLIGASVVGWQREGGAANLIATKLEDWTPLLGRLAGEMGSRDFH